MFRNCCYEDNYIRHEENDRKSFKVWIEKSCSDTSYVFVILTNLQLSLQVCEGYDDSRERKIISATVLFKVNFK